MIQLCGMSSTALKDYIKQKGQSAFRGDQLVKWVASGTPIEEMSNLPAALRKEMSREAVTNPVRVREIFESKLDGTRKFLFELSDGNLIEGVLMRYRHGCTLCLSTQVGCRMGCLFCASTLDGCVRDLSPGEMAGQVLLANEALADSGERVGNLVLMGSGEPLDNYENTVAFLKLVTAPDGMNLSARSISLSTCGLVPMIDRFSGEGLPVTLSLSLHAPDDAIRRRIMPIAKRYGIQETLDALKRYIGMTGRRVVIEYILIGGLNCEPAHAWRLAGLLRGMQCHVNLIPLNTVSERDLRPPARRQMDAFLTELTRCHISATIRREMGNDIQGACGQLRRSVIHEKGKNEG